MKKDITETIYLKNYTVPNYLIEKVDLEFELGEDFTLVKSILALTENPATTRPNKNLVLDGEELELVAISLNGKRLEQDQWQKTDSDLTLFNVPPSFTLEIHTRIKPQENTALSGLYKSSGNFCTQCEAQGFRRITYFLDRPDVMAPYTTTIIADEKRYPILLSNGNLIAEQKLAAGKHKVTWQDPFKKPCYLFALVAGDLEFMQDFFITQSGRRITLRIFVEKNNLDKCAHAMQAVKKAMHWDEITFNREYDLDIYMIVAVSDFNMGAMENKGLNIFNTKYILAKPETATDMDFLHVESVIAHEYFHNWTGNRITCRDWFQLSLKEGLTIFRDQSFTEDTTSKAVARIHDVNDLRNTQFAEDAGPLAHPVRPESYIEINNFYTTTIYNKGAELIRMQQTILGEKLFRQGMDLYFTRHDGQAVTIEDFVKSMEDASHINLTQFRLWYSQAGTPVLTINDQYDEAKKTYTLTIKQTCPPTPGQPEKKPLHVPIVLGLLDSSSGAEISLQKNKQSGLLQLRKSEEVFHFEDIAVRPVPSILRHFSAPVKINYAYSDAALQLLFKHDSDLFNRWEAGQKFAVNLILRLIKDFRADVPLAIPQDYLVTLKHLLLTLQEDKLLLTEMLTLPSEKYLGGQMESIDVEGIYHVREFILKEIACYLKNDLLDVYQKNHDLKKPYEFNMDEMGKRQLKNYCLGYLMKLGDVDIYEKIGVRQFKDALKHNMTDSIAALGYLVNVDYAGREAILTEFYHYWQKDALVIDKWFALQAVAKLPDTLSKVKKLFTHPAFDIKNPNKVYALIGTFAQGNLIRFHAANGCGYQFLAECVVQLDKLNPQIAARMVSPLSAWRRYDLARQQLMRKQLEFILQQKTLSKDVSELVNKSLYSM